jgi:hypothetical protein
MMPTYDVTLDRDVSLTERQTFRVVAEDDDAAYKQALDLAGDSDLLTWDVLEEDSECREVSIVEVQDAQVPD